jgi:hypothetical protein
MKEKIYTIPVTDAYRSVTACPLCALAANVEENALDYYLGASLMEPDVRKTTNTTGFCGQHLNRMYGKEINRLGMGLMLHTHLLDLQRDISEELLHAAPSSGSFLKGRDKDYKKNLEALADKVEARMDSCIICNKISGTMDRYLDVLLWMFFEDAGFKELFLSKDSHCLYHTAFLLRGAAKHLSQNQASEFVSAFAQQQKNCLTGMIEDMEWFTQKFDYRNKDKSWGNSKDAIPRAISFLSGEGSVKDVRQQG